MGRIIMPGGGATEDLDIVTATAADVIAGKVIVGPDGEPITGTIPSLSARTVTPGTSNQVISSGNYLSGNLTIVGDPDLVAANIRSGANIFGVAGSCQVFKSVMAVRVNSAGTASFNVYVNGSGSKTTRTLPYLRYTSHGFNPIFLCYKQGWTVDNGIAIFSRDYPAIEMNTGSGTNYRFMTNDNSNIIINASTIQVPIHNGNSADNYGYLYIAGY